MHFVSKFHSDFYGFNIPSCYPNNPPTKAVSGKKITAVLGQIKGPVSPTAWKECNRAACKEITKEYSPTSTCNFS